MNQTKQIQKKLSFIIKLYDFILKNPGCIFKKGLLQFNFEQLKIRMQSGAIFYPFVFITKKRKQKNYSRLKNYLILFIKKTFTISCRAYLRKTSITGISTLGLFTGNIRFTSFSPVSCLSQ